VGWDACKSIAAAKGNALAMVWQLAGRGGSGGGVLCLAVEVIEKQVQKKKGKKSTRRFKGDEAAP